jgi:Ca2+-transporting ATPase
MLSSLILICSISIFYVVIILLLGWLQHGNILEMFTIAVSLAVAAIPEGLPIVVTVTLALGVMRMAKKNAIAKKLPVVETLACVNVVCSDKTGTLTQNRMEVVELYTPDHNVVHVGGDSFKCDRENGENVLYYPSITKIVKIGTICNNAHWKDGKLIGQAVEKALLSLAEKLNCLNIRENYVRISEHSFRSDQKWMAVNVLKKQECVPSNDNKDSVWFMKGSLETVLRQCSHMSYDQTPLSTKTRHCLEGVANQMARRGHRVLAFAEGQDLMNLGFVGLAAFSDCLRDGVALAVADLLNGGVEVKMITGDSFETAQAVAKDIGILKEDSVCISGEELEKFESLSNKLVELVNCASVFYRVTPVHKVTIVKALQLSGKVVAMTGDGTNDAIAVKRAEIGIAMGVVGTDVCREAADLILTDDNFSTILRAVEEGKGIYYNIRNFVRFQLST